MAFSPGRNRSFLCLFTTLPDIFLHIKTSPMEFFDVWTNHWTQEKKERKKESKGGGGYMSDSMKRPWRPELLVREIIYSPVQYELITCNSIYSVSL